MQGGRCASEASHLIPSVKVSNGNPLQNEAALHSPSTDGAERNLTTHLRAYFQGSIHTPTPHAAAQHFMGSDCSVKLA